MSFTKEWAQEIIDRNRQFHQGVVPKWPIPEPGSVQVIPSDRYKNKWERNYAQHLDLRKYMKEIQSYRYEGLAFRLAANTYLHPDFLVVIPNGRMEIHEVKGRKTEKWWSRWKIAKEMFPWFTWRVFRIEKGQWVEIG